MGYGLLAYLGYTLLIKKNQTPVSPITQVPGTPLTTIPVTNPGGASLIPTITNTAGSLFNKLFPPSTTGATAPNAATTTTPSTQSNFQGTINTVFPTTQFQPVPDASIFTQSNATVVSPTDTSNLFSSDTMSTDDLLALEEQMV